MSIPIGTSIGAYEVLSKIGEGGMGEVYRARDTRLQREVALKLLPASVLGDPRPRGHAVMLNVIGRRPPARGFLAMAGVHWHDYGKSERPRRKLGHVTVVAGSRQARDRAARRLRRLLKFE